MSKKKKKKSGGDGGDPSAWMATFSDLNFLMITFFVLLLSMSSMDERRFSDIFGEEIAAVDEEVLRPEPPMGRAPMPAIIPARGAWVGYPQDLPVDPVPGSRGRHSIEGDGMMQKSYKSPLSDPRGDQLDEKLRKALRQVDDLLKVDSITDDEIRLSVEDSLFFEGDDYRPSPKARQILSSIADLSNQIGGSLHVQANRGHWHLASKRSAYVAMVMVRQGMEGNRVTADVISGTEGILNFSIKRSVQRPADQSEEEQENGGQGQP